MDKIIKWVLVAFLCLPILIFLRRLTKSIGETVVEENRKDKESKVR